MTNKFAESLLTGKQKKRDAEEKKQQEEKEAREQAKKDLALTVAREREEVARWISAFLPLLFEEKGRLGHDPEIRFSEVRYPHQRSIPNFTWSEDTFWAVVKDEFKDSLRVDCYEVEASNDPEYRHGSYWVYLVKIRDQK